MKTTAITVERNYRIDNFDQYMKARLSHSVEPEEGETMQDATLRAISMLDTVFRVAYPHVDEHLNFVQVKQVSFKVTPEIPNEHKQPEEPHELNVNDINSCADVEVLKSYKFLVRSNTELSEAYRKKLIELSPK